MNSRQRMKWAETRKMGRKKFVWIRGVLYWGVSTSVLWTMLSFYLDSEFDIVINSNINHLGRFIIFLLVFSVIGYFWGSYIWRVSERRYNRR